MFTNDQRQQERTGKYGTPRFQYLQELVIQFQNATTEDETKEKILANLANFAYDPYNYNFLRQLNVLELFLDCITEPNEKLVEFGIGGICNSCADPGNAAIVTECGGVPLIIQCLSSPVRNTLVFINHHPFIIIFSPLPSHLQPPSHNPHEDPSCSGDDNPNSSHSATMDDLILDGYLAFASRAL